MEPLGDATMAQWLQDMIPRSRRRAALAGLPHSIPDGYGEVLYRRQNGLCAVTGMEFSLREFPNVLVKHPFAPSLDRRTSHRGYEPDNVRLVCIAVNFGMGQWGQELYLTFARAAVEFEHRLERLASGVPDAPLPEITRLDGLLQAETSDWDVRQRERIDAAMDIASTLSGEALRHQKRHIAGLRRAQALGPAGLEQAARRARKSRDEISQ
jgi:hypothetical protein